MDAALHSADRCVKLGQTRAGDTVCEPCYGTGCKKNGHRGASRMGYVISLQHVMDTAARCKDFLLFPSRSSALSVQLSLVTVAIVKTVMGVAQGFVLKFTVRSQRDNKTVMR